MPQRTRSLLLAAPPAQFPCLFPCCRVPSVGAITPNALTGTSLASSSLSASGEFSRPFTHSLFLRLLVLAASVCLFLCVRWVGKGSGSAPRRALRVTGLGSPCGAVSGPRCVAPSARPGCVRKGPRHAPRLTFTSTAPAKGQLKSRHAQALPVLAGRL